MEVNTTLVERIGRGILDYSNPREAEYEFAWQHLKGCQSILDVGCGTGTFMERAPSQMIGIDINSENVDYCREKGLTAQPGDALNLPFPDATFDGTHSSHLLQVFAANDGVRLLKELARVTKPGGTIVITTLNDFRRFFRHPENARPWPPDALFRLLHKQRGAQSPMFPGMPNFDVGPIRRRRPPLIEFEFPSTYSMQRYCAVLNALQSATGLRKWWTFDAYTIVFRKIR